MNREILVCIITLIATFVPNGLHGQDYREDVKGYLKAYENFDNKKMSISIMTFTLPTDTKPKNTMKYEVYKKAGLFCQKSTMMTMALVGTKLIMLDHTNRKIIYRAVKAGALEAKQLNAQYSPNQIDTLLKNIDKYKISFLGTENGVKQYNIENFDPVIRAMQIGFDANTQKLRKIVYYYNKNEYNESSKVEITFEDSELKKEDDVLFLESSYVELKNNVLVAAPAYKTYQIVQVKD